MSVYYATLFPITASPSRVSAWATLIAASGGWFYPGTLIADTTGLVAKLRVWGTACTFRHNTFGNGASYKVKVDSDPLQTFTGAGSAATNNRDSRVLLKLLSVHYLQFMDLFSRFSSIPSIYKNHWPLTHSLKKLDRGKLHLLNH